MAVLNQIGHETIVVGATAVGLRPRSPTGGTIRPRRALIHVGAQPIRWLADGGVPEGTVGMTVETGARIDWTGGGEDDLEHDAWGLVMNVKFVRDAGAAGDATLSVLYFN